MTLALAAFAIAVLEISRCLWHGLFRRSVPWVATHQLSIWLLMGLAWLATGFAWWPPVVAALSFLAAEASYWLLKWWDGWKEGYTFGGYYFVRSEPPPGSARRNVAEWAFRRRTFLRWHWDAWHVLSAGSSWPIEVATILAVCWPLPGWWRWAALGGFAVEGVLLKLLWRWPRLRPSHWR